MHYVLKFVKSRDFNLFAFCDADNEASFDCRRSITRYCVYFDSKKQGIVSRSSCEAKYRALANTVYRSIT